MSGSEMAFSGASTTVNVSPYPGDRLSEPGARGRRNAVMASSAGQFAGQSGQMTVKQLAIDTGSIASLHQRGSQTSIVSVNDRRTPLPNASLSESDFSGDDDDGESKASSSLTVAGSPSLTVSIGDSLSAGSRNSAPAAATPVPHDTTSIVASAKTALQNSRQATQGVSEPGLWERLSNWWHGLPSAEQISKIRNAASAADALAARSLSDSFRDLFAQFFGRTTSDTFTSFYNVTAIGKQIGANGQQPGTLSGNLAADALTSYLAGNLPANKAPPQVSIYRDGGTWSYEVKAGPAIYVSTVLSGIDAADELAALLAVEEKLNRQLVEAISQALNTADAGIMPDAKLNELTAALAGKNQLQKYGTIVDFVADTVREKYKADADKGLSRVNEAVYRAAQLLPESREGNCNISHVYKELADDLHRRHDPEHSTAKDLARADYTVAGRRLKGFSPEALKQNIVIFKGHLKTLQCTPEQEAAILTLASQKITGMVQASAAACNGGAVAVEQMQWAPSPRQGQRNMVMYDISGDGESISLVARAKFNPLDKERYVFLKENYGDPPSIFKHETVSLALNIDKKGVVTVKSMDAYTRDF